MLKKYKECYYCDKTGKLFDKDKKEIVSHPLLNSANFLKLRKNVLEDAGEKELAEKIVLEAKQAEIAVMAQAEMVQEVAVENNPQEKKPQEPLTIESQPIEVELEEVELSNGKKLYNSKVLS